MSEKIVGETVMVTPELESAMRSVVQMPSFSAVHSEAIAYSVEEPVHRFLNTMLDGASIPDFPDRGDLWHAVGAKVDTPDGPKPYTFFIGQLTVHGERLGAVSRVAVAAVNEELALRQSPFRLPSLSELRI